MNSNHNVLTPSETIELETLTSTRGSARLNAEEQFGQGKDRYSFDAPTSRTVPVQSPMIHPTTTNSLRPMDDLYPPRAAAQVDWNQVKQRFTDGMKSAGSWIKSRIRAVSPGLSVGIHDSIQDRRQPDRVEHKETVYDDVKNDGGDDDDGERRVCKRVIESANLIIQFSTERSTPSKSFSQKDAHEPHRNERFRIHSVRPYLGRESILFGHSQEDFDMEVEHVLDRYHVQLNPAVKLNSGESVSEGILRFSRNQDNSEPEGEDTLSAKRDVEDAKPGVEDDGKGKGKGKSHAAGESSSDGSRSDTRLLSRSVSHQSHSPTASGSLPRHVNTAFATLFVSTSHSNPRDVGIQQIKRIDRLIHLKPRVAGDIQSIIATTSTMGIHAFDIHLVLTDAGTSTGTPREGSYTAKDKETLMTTSNPNANSKLEPESALFRRTGTTVNFDLERKYLDTAQPLFTPDGETIHDIVLRKQGELHWSEDHESVKGDFEVSYLVGPASGS